jgi:REP element-mobilizing transposase RayT
MGGRTIAEQASWPKQGTFIRSFNRARVRTHGGKRRGAGRKPAGERAGVEHTTRPEFTPRDALLVTWRVVSGAPSLRRPSTFQRVVDCLTVARERGELRLVHFSVQSNHVHAIVEASDRQALGRAMQGLGVRLARALNSAWSRVGRVFTDRFHSLVLSTPRAVRNALLYVLNNARKHGVRVEGLDPCSSAAAFDGWRERPTTLDRDRAPPVSPAQTWLLRVGWRKHGLLGVLELPAACAGVRR